MCWFCPLHEYLEYFARFLVFDFFTIAYQIQTICSFFRYFAVLFDIGIVFQIKGFDSDFEGYRHVLPLFAGKVTGMPTSYR